MHKVVFKSKTGLTMPLFQFSLQDRIKHVKRNENEFFSMHEDEVNVVFDSISRALVYIHKLGFVHCDVKPGNIFVNNSVCFLADFGSLVKFGRDRKEYSEFFIKRGDIAKPVSYKDDWWALLVTCLQLLCIKEDKISSISNITLKKSLMEIKNGNYDLFDTSAPRQDKSEDNGCCIF